MKNVINKIIKILNTPKGKINPNIFVFLIIVGMITAKFTGNIGRIIVCGIFFIILLIYVVISLYKKQLGSLLAIYIEGALISLIVIVGSYLDLMGIDSNYVATFIPIVLSLFFITIYKSVFATGNNEKIKKAKIITFIGIPLLTIWELIFIVALIQHKL